MRTMEIPRFPQKISFADLENLYKTRLQQKPSVHSSVAIPLLGYMAWPNDDVARQNGTEILKGWMDGEDQSPDFKLIHQHWGHVADIVKVAANANLSPTRLKDLRSAVLSYAALIDSSPPHVVLDLAAIRSVLDLMVPIQAKISRKRWANLRSDLSAAITASGLLQMIKTSKVELGASWVSLLTVCARPRARAPRSAR
jgi:hypothetical protein